MLLCGTHRFQTKTASSQFPAFPEAVDSFLSSFGTSSFIHEVGGGWRLPELCGVGCSRPKLEKQTQTFLNSETSLSTNKRTPFVNTGNLIVETCHAHSEISPDLISARSHQRQLDGCEWQRPSNKHWRRAMCARADPTYVISCSSCRRQRRLAACWPDPSRFHDLAAQHAA
jgi:hypothetical protein